MFNQAITLRPDYAEAYLNRGLTYRRLKQYDRAIADYSKVMQLAPRASVPYYNRALAHAQKGDFKRALADVDRYIAMKPGDPDGPKLRKAIVQAMNGARR